MQSLSCLQGSQEHMFAKRKRMESICKELKRKVVPIILKSVIHKAQSNCFNSSKKNRTLKEYF